MKGLVLLILMNDLCFFRVYLRTKKMLDLV